MGKFTLKPRNQPLGGGPRWRSLEVALSIARGLKAVKNPGKGKKRGLVVALADASGFHCAMETARTRRQH